MKIETSVIIPNFNGKELLFDCLDSLFKQTYKNFEVFVVDNNSGDDSVSYIEKNFKEVKIIKLNKNYGFAKAVNEGVKVCKSEFVVFLNNDTSVDKNYLKNLVNYVKLHKEVISVNPKILNFYKKKIIDGLGIQINEVGQARSIGWQEIDKGQYENKQYIFGATGGASLFKRKEFIKVGLFDEKYFMYFEEVDFAFKAQFLGLKSIYCPKAIVFHKHKATSSKFPQHIEYWQFKNMMQTIIRNFPFEILKKDFRWLKIILIYLNTIFYQIRNGFFWPPIVTTIWLLANLPKLLSERKNIQLTRKVSNKYLESFLTKKNITFWGLHK